jgi:predicted enzyme related to lactoylglutathione lyase
MKEAQTPTFGNGKICYLEMPSNDIAKSASFYSHVFNWNIRTRGDGSTSFDDGVFQVSGVWTLDKTPVDGGIIIYIMIADMDTTKKLIESNGGTIIDSGSTVAGEQIAKFKDPAGNMMGLYEQKGI